MRLILPDEMLFKGLEELNYRPDRINRAKPVTNEQRFKAHYGVFPFVCCCVWEDLQTTVVVEARVNQNDKTGQRMDEFFESCRWDNAFQDA